MSLVSRAVFGKQPSKMTKIASMTPRSRPRINRKALPRGPGPPCPPRCPLPGPGPAGFSDAPMFAVLVAGLGMESLRRGPQWEGGSRPAPSSAFKGGRTPPAHPTGRNESRSPLANRGNCAFKPFSFSSPKECFECSGLWNVQTLPGAASPTGGLREPPTPPAGLTGRCQSVWGWAAAAELPRQQDVDSVEWQVRRESV